MRFLKDGTPINLCFTEFSTCFTESRVPIQANRTRNLGQNSVKYRPTLRNSASPLQQDSELHQKDLRINLYLGHIWDPEIKAFLRADMFLALSLIVDKSVSRGSIMARRVVIPVKRPCELY